MSIKTSPRARAREDRAGDPLDGLVNLFDLGIVLAVAFLLAALSSLKLTRALTDRQTSQPPVTINRNQSTHSLMLKPNERVVGQGTRVGSVYRLADGRLIYVAPKGNATAK